MWLPLCAPCPTSKLRQAGVTADTVPPEDAVRHGSITLANAVLPQRIRSAIDSTIENTILRYEMTIVDVRSTPVHYRIWFFTHENNHDRGGSYTWLLQHNYSQIQL